MPVARCSSSDHDALVRGVQVLDDDKRHAAARRHVPQELLEGLQPAGGGADADDGEDAASGGARLRSGLDRGRLDGGLRCKLGRLCDFAHGPCFLLLPLGAPARGRGRSGSCALRRALGFALLQQIPWIQDSKYPPLHVAYEVPTPCLGVAGADSNGDERRARRKEHAS